MGLMLRIVAVAGLLLAAVFAPLLRKAKPAAEPDSRERRLTDLVQRWSELRLRWSATGERDSLLRRLAKLPEGTSDPQVWLQGLAPGFSGEGVRRALAAQLQPVGPIDPAVGIGVLVYKAELYDSESRWSIYSGAWIGEAAGKTWCIAIEPGYISRKGELQAHFASALSPCLLYAAFGRPGAGVAAWLAGSRYASVRSNNWLSRPKGWRDGYEQPPWHSAYDPTWFDNLIQARSSRLWEMGVGDLAIALAPPYQLGALALRCLEGEAEFCRRAIVDTTGSGKMLPGVPGDLTLGGAFLRWRGNVLGARPVADSYLSDLIRDQGRDRFRLFWQSDRSLAQAFRTAFGKELGEWTGRWARQQWEASNERSFRSSDIILGATLAPSWPLLIAGWTLLALGLAVSAARRRQVS